MKLLSQSLQQLDGERDRQTHIQTHATERITSCIRGGNKLSEIQK